MSEALDRDLIMGACTGRLGSRVMVFRETESTSDIVLRAAEGGESEGLVVFAESQTKGRGQFGRRWSSSAGLGLWFSVLLRPQWPASLLTGITPLVAVGVARALAEACSLDIRIKQPNDILCGDRKMAGILSEARTGSDLFVVVGIGINVNHAQGDFPLELRTTASSLALETGREWPQREPLAVAVLNAIGGLYDRASPPGQSILDEYAALSRRSFCDSFAP
jgi:BirA family transcriptional regulator, biotin operon repressor / biotin---[acetyl-CoA-carboxylase] ligase